MVPHIASGFLLSTVEKQGLSLNLESNGTRGLSIPTGGRLELIPQKNWKKKIL